MLDRFKKTEQGIKRTRETWFRRLSHLFDRGAVDEETWTGLEEVLLSADVGVPTTSRLLELVKERARREKLSGEGVRAALKGEMVKLLRSDGGFSLPQEGASVLLTVGVNGVGKTTSIAKLAYLFKGQGKKVLLAASDTFRAAAIDQLEVWGERLGVEVISHKPGSDPGAVVFDALKATLSRRAHVLIIDTAGRLHTKTNLMEELKKIRRVIDKAGPGATCKVLLVLDATTGQNGLAQAGSFHQAVGVSGVFLAKLDGTAKGGIVLAICQELHLPILFIGTGQGLEDLAPFDAEQFVEALFTLEA